MNPAGPFKPEYVFGDDAMNGRGFSNASNASDDHHPYDNGYDQPEKPPLKKGDNTMNISPKRLEEIKNIPDYAIDTSDIPELDDNFWSKAKMVKPITKKAISIRLDSDVLDWFKSQGKGYQSLINNVLRTYVNHHQNKPKI